jgi:hypothetical protein
MVRPMYRGGPPRPSGIFDAKEVLPPTKLSAVYNNGGLPCKIDLVGGEEDNGRPKGGRTIKWLTPIKDIKLEEIMPLLVEGL